MSHKKTRRAFAWLMVNIMIFTLFVPPSMSRANAEGANDSGKKTDESVIQHDLFEFEASINHNNIADGTAPFDRNDEPGNDSGEHNRIVRAWDTVTYPVKMTINPKKTDMLENIKVKLTGTLENGITKDQVNASFAIGGYADLKKEEVGFTQEYTIQRTGNSIMLPVTINVHGAKNGLVLTPNITVEVISVDGKPIKGVKTKFDDLPGVAVSSKVNIKPYVGSGLTDAGFPYMPYSKLTNANGKDSDVTGIYAFAVSWGIDKLPGKSDIKGAAFPEPDGTINFTVELAGEVYWSGGPKQKQTDLFDFEGQDIRVELFDHRPVMNVARGVGQKHMLADGVTYNFTQPINFWAPRSSMLGLNANQIQNESLHSVMDSGKWDISAQVNERHKTVYKGSNTGFTIGDTFPSRQANYGLDRPAQFGLDSKLFSSHSFLVDMQNEYRINGPLNPKNYSNNVYYRVKVVLDNYVDPEGNVTEYNKSGAYTNHQRNETGNMNAYGTFKAYPYKGYRHELGYLSDKQKTAWSSPVGDAAIVVGSDVYFEARVIPATGLNLYGGYEAVYRWNTDAFELTKKYAEEADADILALGYRNLVFDWIKNNREKQTNYYGVAKFRNNEFSTYMTKGIDDYRWYRTYDEAIKHGPVGAIKSDVRAPVGGIKSEQVYIPLRVKHENIGFGSETKQGTPLVATVNFYVYLDEERKQVIDATKNQVHQNPSKWNDLGTLLEMQRPVGGSVNFESLGVVPAKTTTLVKSDKDTYYNSETIKWTVDNSVTLPSYGVPDGIDSGVTVTQTLPKGLNYKTGSGKVDGAAVEPEITKNADGTTNLVWRTFISNQSRKIPSITFETTINPFALVANSVQSSVTVKSVIESEMDGRPVDLRTSTKSVTILKVGMVGIYESINENHGDKNSDFTLTLSPYTTVEDEEDVTGLTHLPLSGDPIGSSYSGTAVFSKIETAVNRRHNDKPVDIYLNKEIVRSNAPQKIDVTKDGWYKYTGDPSQLDGALSVWFRINGKMTNVDDIQIKLTVQTNGNKFGDKYLSESVINSATDYRLSPISNRVQYTIRADLELALERFQIYTNKASDGLPTSIRVNQTVLDEEAVKDKEIILAIYDTSSGKKVAEKTYKQSELQRENSILIPPDTLTKGEKKNYEARLEGYDENMIWVRDGEGSIDTDGYTAKEKTLTIADADADGHIKFKDVTMTERELHKDMVKYYETLTIPRIAEPKVKSGYGYEFKPKVTYTNEWLTGVQAHVANMTPTSDVAIAVNHHLIDESLEYYDKTADYADDDKIKINMQRTEARDTNNVTTSYTLPQMYLEAKTGLMYTSHQKENGELSGEPLDAGFKLYVPIWIKSVGAYDASFISTQGIGSHFTKFDVLRKVHVEAYMFNHTDSETPEIDELLIHPIKQDEIPEDW